MNDLKFLPITEEYYPTPYNVYRTTFNLGFFQFVCSLIDASIIKFNRQIKEMLRQNRPDLTKRYIAILNVGDVAWIWETSDSLKQIEINYRKIIKDLKRGENVEFKDLSKRSSPIRLSYRGIEFIW